MTQHRSGREERAYLRGVNDVKKRTQDRTLRKTIGGRDPCGSRGPMDHTKGDYRSSIAPRGGENVMNIKKHQETLSYAIVHVSIQSMYDLLVKLPPTARSRPVSVLTIYAGYSHSSDMSFWKCCSENGVQ